MNIQLPVVIWTVICFLLLMLILRNLLFKPVLELLDKRKEKIARAEQKKAELAALADEHEKRLEIIKEDERIQRDNYIKGELKLIRIQNKTRTEEEKAARFNRVEDYKKETEKEKEEIKQHFSESVEEIAKIFAQRLISQ